MITKRKDDVEYFIDSQNIINHIPEMICDES